MNNELNFNGVSDEVAMKELGWSREHFKKVARELSFLNGGNAWTLSKDAWALLHYYRNPKKPSQIIND